NRLHLMTSIKKGTVATHRDHQINVLNHPGQIDSGYGFKINFSAGQFILNVLERGIMLLMRDLDPRHRVALFLQQLDESRLAVFHCLDLERRLFVYDEDLTEFQTQSSCCLEISFVAAIMAAGSVTKVKSERPMR